jgi:hypothetical protein
MTVGVIFWIKTPIKGVRGWAGLCDAGAILDDKEVMP